MRRTFVPDYSSRGAVQNPPPEAPRSLPPPPRPTARPTVSWNPPPPPPPPAPVARAPAAPIAVQRAAVPMSPPPEPVTTGFSPHLETFPSLGTSYFITDTNIAEQVSIWAKYPATQDVKMDGFSIVNGGAGTFAGDLAAANGNFSGNGVFNGSLTSTGGATIIGDVNVYSGNLTVNSGQVVSDTVVLVNNLANDPGRLVMFDNNGNQHILKSIDANLYFDNELLAKANDIQNIADWSLYPALQNVDMDGKALDNASQVTVTDGTNPQVLTASAGGLLVNGQAVATGTVVKSVNTDAGDIVLESADNSVVITKPVAGTINFAVPAGAGGVASLNAQTGAVSLSSTGGSITITNPGPGQINLESATGNVADWATFPAVSAVNMQDNGINISPTPTGYPNSQLDTNLQIGKPSYVLFPTIDMYPSTFRVGGLTAPATSVDFNSLGAFTVNSGVGIALTGGGGVSIVGGGGISALGATITLGAGAVSALGGSINLGGGTINMAGGLINALGAAVNIGGGLITATTGGLLVTAGSVVVGTSSNAGAGILCYGGKIQCSPSLLGGGGGLEMNSTPITGVSTINGAPYPPANPFDLAGLLNKINAYPALPYTTSSSSTPAANQSATAIVPDGSFPVNVPTVGAVQGGWGFSKPAGSVAFFNWYYYNPRFTAPAAPLPYIKSRVQSAWALIRPTVNLYSAGYLGLNLYSYDDANPPTSGFYNTRWAYSNTVGALAGATGTNLFAGYTYLIYAQDTPRITNTSAIGVPDNQVSTLRDPYDIYTDVNHIPLSNCIVAFNPWTDGTYYRSWNTGVVYVAGQTVVFAGFGSNYNGIFYTCVTGHTSSAANAPVVNGILSPLWSVITPQPSSFADQPVLAMNINQITNSPLGGAQAVGYVVLDMGFSYGPSTTSTTVSQHISLLPN